MLNILLKLFSRLKANKLLFSLLYSLVLVIVTLFFIPIRFEENDDVVMLLLASGNYTGQFESNLIFINPLYGKIVSFFYCISSDFEWYTLLFVAFHWISLGIISTKLLEMKVSKVVKITLILFFSVIGVNFLMYLQFTTVAMFLSIAVFFMCSFDYSKKMISIVPILILSLASLIRPEIVLLLTVSIFPFFLINSIRYKNYFKLGISISLVLLPILSMQLRDKLLISQEWIEATTYNRLRAEVTDNINADYAYDNYKGVCSEADYNLLKNFFIAPDFFTSVKLEALRVKVQQKESIFTKLMNIPFQLKNYLKEFLFFGLILMILFFKNPSKKECLLIFLYGCFLLSLSAYLSLDGMLKNRVFIAFVLLYVLVIAFSISSFQSLHKFHYFGVSFVVLLFSVYYLRRLNEKVEETNQIRYGYLENQIAFTSNYFSHYPNSSLIPFGDDLKIQYLNPFKISKTTRDWHLFYLGWMTNNPYNSTYEEAFKSNFTVLMTNYTALKNESNFSKSDYYVNYSKKELLKNKDFSILVFEK